MHLHPALELVISICLMSVTVLVGWRVVLGTKPLPVVQSLTIATVANLMGKLFVSIWHLPPALGYSLGIVAMAIVVLTWWGNNRVSVKTRADTEVRTLLAMAFFIVATTLVMANWRLHAWIAATRGVALAEIERSMPLWSVNLFAVIVAIWVGTLLLVTRPESNRPRE
jgi:hypothetical protein